MEAPCDKVFRWSLGASKDRWLSPRVQGLRAKVPATPTTWKGRVMRSVCSEKYAPFYRFSTSLTSSSKHRSCRCIACAANQVYPDTFGPNSIAVKFHWRVLRITLATPQPSIRGSSPRNTVFSTSDRRCLRILRQFCDSKFYSPNEGPCIQRNPRTNPWSPATRNLSHSLVIVAQDMDPTEVQP